MHVSNNNNLSVFCIIQRVTLALCGSLSTQDRFISVLPLVLNFILVFWEVAGSKNQNDEFKLHIAAESCTSQSGDPGVSAADSSSLIWSGSAVLLNRSLNPIRGRQRETEWRASRGRRSFGLAAPEEEKLRAKPSRWQNSVSELLT